MTLASDAIRIITSNLHFSCAEYGLQTWFKPPQRFRLLTLDIRNICDKAC